MSRLIVILTTLMMAMAVPAMADEQRDLPPLGDKESSGTLTDTAAVSCTELFNPFTCKQSDPAVRLCADEQRECQKCFAGDVERASWCAKRMGPQ